MKIELYWVDLMAAIEFGSFIEILYQYDTQQKEGAVIFWTNIVGNKITNPFKV